MCKWGINKEVKLCNPKVQRPVAYERRLETSVKVDSCIADFIQYLNNKGIETMSCCCGHGKKMSSVIIKYKGRNVELLFDLNKKQRDNFLF